MLFPTQIAGARLRASQHELAVMYFYARSYAVSVLFIRVGGSLQTVVKMFTDVLRASACRVTCWRDDQQSGHYGHAKHKFGQARLGEVGEGYATQQHGGVNSAGPGQVGSNLPMKTKTQRLQIIRDAPARGKNECRSRQTALTLSSTRGRGG